MNKRILWSLATAATLVAGAVFATGASAGTHGMRQGMMGGYGMSQGMMGSAPAATRTGPAASGPQYYGMGPGMMQGYGYGRHGTRGGYGRYGMGPGMMGGYGMGPGMMGGYGMGPGMMGGYGAYALGLNADQRGKIAGIWNSTTNKAWPILGQLREQYFQFSQLMAETNPDKAAVNKVYARIGELQRQLLDQRLDARKQMLEVLTPDQRKKLEQGFYHRWR